MASDSAFVGLVLGVMLTCLLSYSENIQEHSEETELTASFYPAQPLSFWVVCEANDFNLIPLFDSQFILPSLVINASSCLMKDFDGSR